MTLLQSLEATYAWTPTVTTDGRELSLPWKVLPGWLPKDLCCAQSPATLLALPSPTVPALPPPAQAVASQQQQPTTPVVPIVDVELGLDMAQAPTA